MTADEEAGVAPIARCRGVRRDVARTQFERQCELVDDLGR